MEIGQPQRETTIYPLHEPVGRPEPAPVTREPVAVPDREQVPA